MLRAADADINDTICTNRQIYKDPIIVNIILPVLNVGGMIMIL